LQKEAAIGVDLESDSLFYFPERVCLVQISTPFENFLVDPLALEDLSPLEPVFADAKIRKIFHGADYDIRSLDRDFGIRIRSLFDTQVAARFLGVRETGLASLLKTRLGVVIEKKYQKKDWSQRPLPDPMVAYAAEDSRHLIALAGNLEEELIAKGRISWVDKECRLLSRVRHPPPNRDPLFLKFKGAGKLSRRGLAILEAILKFRERLAGQWHRPPFKILGNEPIMEMAEKSPKTKADLKAIKGLSPRQINTFGDALLGKIGEALSLPDERLPVYPRKRRKSFGPEVSKRMNALKEWRRQRAIELDLDQALVCNNAQILSLSLADPKKPKDLQGVGEIKDWQRKVFGDEICAVLKSLDLCG
ncbi:MAG: ribonuclease D, partial [Deltaproteobacteria bacterium]|nr:ribonuclease D [Deltaproteobacteria bacterium]